MVYLRCTDEHSDGPARWETERRRSESDRVRSAGRDEAREGCRGREEEPNRRKGKYEATKTVERWKVSVVFVRLSADPEASGQALTNGRNKFRIKS